MRRTLVETTVTVTQNRRLWDRAAGAETCHLVTMRRDQLLHGVRRALDSRLLDNNIIPVTPDMPVAKKAATVLGLAEDAHHKPYSPYNRVSIPYNQDPETASTRGIHTLSPRHGPTMDDAYNGLALELARGTGQRSNAGRPAATQTIPSSTPTVFPKDTSIRQAWRESSMPTPKSVIRKPVQSGSPSPAPPRNGEYRRLAGQAKYHPHHSRQPEGAFF